MKVYDYKGFKRGKVLANIKRPQGQRGRLDRIGKRNVLELIGDALGTTDEKRIVANDFETDFITFCYGKDENSNLWEWVIVPSIEMIKKIKAANLRDFGTEYFQKEYLKEDFKSEEQKLK